jgi:hypothetical protein
MQIHTEFRGIPEIFTAKKYRGILYVFLTINVPDVYMGQYEVVLRGDYL